MTEQELTIAKKIAEIEGVNVEIYGGKLLPMYTKRNLKNTAVSGDSYNPFSWSTLGPLMVKYEVVPEYAGIASFVAIGIGLDSVIVDFSSKEELPRAILECIIKSKEK